MYPLLTKDPLTGEALVVTRLEGPTTGIVIEGRFNLGWIGRLAPEQVEFVGMLVRQRGNLQKVAAELGIAYNTARNRMDEIAGALGAPEVEQPPPPPPAPSAEHSGALEQLAAGAISFEEAMSRIREKR
jgi:hypothetical protein